MTKSDIQRVNAACTIVSPNYLPFARTLCASYMAHHPGEHFFVLIVADLHQPALFNRERFTAVMLSEIGLKDVRGEAMKYEILELNTNVKPTFMKFLLQRFVLDSLIYLDPDIFVYSPLTPVFAALDSNDAVLTPHMTAPVFDGKLPGEQEILYNGTYNLGFIAVKRSIEGLRLLDWWEERCLALGFSEARTGLFVDQKWMNLAPGLFDNIAILRHPGCNMGFWNLHDRVLSVENAAYTVNGACPLCFFHFSGLVIDDPEMLSKNTNRFTLADRPDLQQLFATYKAVVQSNRKATTDGLAYGFDRFTDGTAITRLARRIYAMHQAQWAGHDPFDSSGEFAKFAKHLGLVKGKAMVQKSTWKEFNSADPRVKLVHIALKVALRILGPVRYELLMRYLGHISVLRHQAVFLKDDRANAGYQRKARSQSG